VSGLVCGLIGITGVCNPSSADRGQLSSRATRSSRSCDPIMLVVASRDPIYLRRKPTRANSVKPAPA